MEIVNYFKGNCESLTSTKGKGNLIDRGLRNSHWQRPGEVSPTGQGFWRMLFYQDLAVTLYTQCFVLESWLFFFCHQPLLPVPTPSRQTSQSYRAIHSQTFLSPLHWAHCPKNTQKKKPCPKHWEFQGTLSLNPNYTSRLFWHGGGFVLLHCAHLTISNRHLCLLLSWRSPGSCWEMFYFILIDFVGKNKPFSKKSLAVCGIPWAGPALPKSRLSWAGLRDQTAQEYNLALPLVNHLCLDQLVT